MANERNPARLILAVSVVVQPNTEFDCQYLQGSNTKTVQVTITDDQGDLSIGH